MSSAHRLRNVHPGEVIEKEFLEPLGLTAYRLAKELHVPLTRIAAILKRRRGITADTALRLARFFGSTPRFWLALQEEYDLEQEARAKSRELARIRPLRRVAG